MSMQNLLRLLTIFYHVVLGLILLTYSINLHASDHIDGAISIQNPVADITDLYAFPNPNKQGNLVLIANVHLATPKTGHFSDRIHYNFLLRPAKLNQSNLPALFQVGTEEARISCRFETPKQEHAPHWVTCYSDRGHSVRTQVNDTQSKESDKGLRVFAGRRSDPFFFYSTWADKTANAGFMPPPIKDNSMQGLNVLSIVLEIDWMKYFSAPPPELIAIAAETLTQDSSDNKGQPVKLRRIDRVGRPEITNVSMVAHQEEDDLRDLYNMETPFTSSINTPLYRERLRKNIDYYDLLDGKKDWTASQADHYANLLVNDYLVIDLNKPCRPDTYLSLEKAILDGKVAQNCGGRHPNDDVMDTLFTTFINANKGQNIRDGVDQPSLAVSSKFPYLHAPEDNLQAKVKTWFVPLLLKFAH
jgi:hypothetical protein